MVLPAIFRFLAVNRILTIVCGTAKASSVFFCDESQDFCANCKSSGLFKCYLQALFGGMAMIIIVFLCKTFWGYKLMLLLDRFMLIDC